MSRRALLLESCEERILCDAAPDVALQVPTNVKIGDAVQITATFDNTSPTDTGFGPYIDLVLKATGTDGAGAAVDDGVTFVNANYLGAPVTATVLTFNALGQATHPYAVDTAGNAVVVSAPPGYGAGDQLVVLQLPFGSFAPGQPPAAVTINLQTSNLADANQPLGIAARGGFQYGNDALNNPATDPSIIDPVYANATITPTLFTLTKTYLGPEDETATGPNFLRQYRLEVDVADGQTLTNLDLTDLLPNTMQFRQLVSASGGGAATSTPSTTTPGGTFTYRFNSVTGAAGVDASVTIEFYVPRVDGGSAVIINANSGNDVALENNASASANWVPLDTRDSTPIGTAITVAVNPAGPEHTLTAKSIATQKSVAIAAGLDTGAPGASPGDTLEYTIQIQVSDYFAFQDLVLTDLFSDGQRFDAGFTPTLTWSEHGTTFAAQNFGAGRFNVALNADNNRLTPATDGTTTVTFDLSAEMAARAGGDGKLVGGAIPNGGTGGPVPPSNPPLPFGPTTATIRFRTVIQDDFSDTYPSGNASLNPGDTLTNSVLVAGNLLQVGNVTTLTGQNEADTSATSVRIVTPVISKAIYAVNGSTTLPVSPTGAILVRPGDTVTYRLLYTVPTGDVENLVLSDYLPLPIFNATQVTTFSTAAPSAAAPPAGTAKWGPTETLRLVAGAPAPTISTVAGNNLLAFNFPANIDDPTNTPRVVDILFTVTAGAQPFADGLFLTNQVQASENNTQQPATAVTSNAIVQIQLQEPSIDAISKGVVGFNSTGLTLGGITFNAPGAATTFSGGPLATAAQATAIGNSELLLGEADAGDAVRFALVVQNDGRSDAFDVTFSDQVINPGYNLPAGASDAARLASLNFALRRGDGTLLVNGTDYTATLSAGGLLTVTMNDNYNAGGGDVGLGGVSRGFNGSTGTAITNGSNTIVATYDLTLTPGGPNAGATLTNTATLTNFAGSNGGPDFTTTDLTDTASVTLRQPTLAKVLTGTEVNSGGNSNTQAVIGELATYTLTLTVPEGSVAAAQLADTLDSGLAFVDVVSVALSSGLTTSNAIGVGATPANVTVGGGGQNVSFNFGTITNANTDNATAETITIVYRAVVLNTNSAPNNQAGTLLNNSASFSGQYTNRPTGTAQSYTTAIASAANVAVIEPALTVAKTVASTVGGPFAATLTNVDAGDAAFYRIVITNTGTPTAFELFLSDSIPAALAGLSVASVTTTGFGATPAPVAGDFQIVGNVLGLNAGGPRGGNIDVPAGATITVVVQGALVATVQPNQNFDNNATIRWTSMDGVVGARSSYNAASGERSGGTLTPAAGVNASTNDAILDNYAMTSGNARITIANPLPVKVIDATSEGSTTTVGGTERVTIGEIVRYRLTWRLPEGVSQNLVFTDQLPTGLQFLNDGTSTLAFVSQGNNLTSSLGTIGNLPNQAGDQTTVGTINPQFVIPAAQITPATPGNGSDPIFSLGTVTNSANNAGEEYVVIEFNAIVLNVVGNQRFDNVAGTDGGTAARANTVNVTVTSNGTGQTSSAVNVGIAEPAITNVTKTVTSSGPYDAGNDVSYQVTFGNVNDVDGATAFDVVLSDILPTTLTNVRALTVTTTGSVLGLASGIVGNTVNVSASSMDINSTVTITYTATLVTTVPANQIVSNTANLTYTSLPGTGSALDDGVASTANSAPTASGTTTGERNGTNGAGADATTLNNYADAGSAAVTLATPTIDKTFKDGTLTADDTNVASSSGASVVIGEQVTYDILVTLPEGVTQALSVIDAIPAGLRVDTIQIITNAAGSARLASSFNGSFTSTPTLGAAVSGAASLTLNFGDTTVAADNLGGNNSFVIRVQATALNIATNQTGTVRTNTASLTYTNPNNGATVPVADGVAANDPAVSVVQPAIVTTKTVSDSTPDSSDTVSYTITLSNTSGQTAYDLSLTDVLPSPLVSPVISAVSSSGTVFVNGVAGPVTSADVVISGATLQFSSNLDAASGSTITIVVTGTVANSATPNQTVTNTATTAWTSTDGTNASERTGADGVGGALNNYASSSSVNFTVPQGGFAKQFFATSEASTTGTNVTIGETATYALIVTLPEGTTPGLNVTDLLPLGLQFVSAQIATTVAASGGLLTADFNGTLPAPTITGGASSGDDVVFSFGSISVVGDNIAANNRFIIFVTAQVTNAAGNSGLAPQTVLPNAASFDISGDGIAAFTTPNVNVTVVEPRMTIAKNIDLANADAGDLVTVTLTVQNTGTSDAFDVIVNDPFPAGKFTDFTAGTTPAGFTFSTSGDSVTFSGGTIADGASATFVFTARLTAAVQPYEVLTNTATVTQATTLPGTASGERDVPDVSGSDSVSVPAPTLIKTLSATSESSTTGSNATIGETVTYALRVTLPEGTTPNLTVVDVLPPGLQYVGFSLDTTGFAGLVPAPTVGGGASNGADVTFTFGAISVSGDNSAASNSFTIFVTAQVLDVVGNVGVAPQTTLPNSATLDIFGDAPGPITSGPVNVTIVEPRMVLAKNITQTSGDAGDTVTVTLTVQNTGTSNAFDVIVTDPFPAGKFTGFAEGTTPAGFAFGAAGDTVTFTGGTIAAGATATFTFTAVLTAAVAPGEVLNNTATVTQATTLPGTVAGEREVPDAAGSDSLAVGVGSYAKSVFATSDGNTTGSNAGIGETITYALRVTLPEGTTNGLNVTDLLPAGLGYIGHSLVTTAAASGGLLTADFAGTVPAPTRTGSTGSGDDQAFSFGTISVAGDNAAGTNSFLLLVEARVLDVVGNVGTTPGQTTLNNQASFDIPTDGVPLFTTPNVPAVVVEPRLQITKVASDNTPDPGQALTYTLTINHTASSTAIAYDVLLRDALPTGLTLDPASISVTGATIESNASTGSLLDLKFADLALGGTITVSYTATVTTSPSSAGTALDNTAKIYWDTDAAEDVNTIRDGGSDGAPDRDLGAGPGNEGFNVNPDPAQDTERVLVNTSTISGVVYRDLNANGSFGGADTGIDGVLLTLTGTDLNGNAISRTATTAGGGLYSFTGLPPGAYTITETQPAGLTDALETVGTNFGGTVLGTLGSNVINGLTIAAQSNLTGVGYNFGEVLPSSVAVGVYFDANNDGARQGGETGIAGVAVRITGTDAFGEAVAADAVTNASGNFVFSNGGTGLRPGTYTVVETAQPAGYLDGRETAGAQGGSTATNEQIGPFTLPTNTAATGYLFGELLPASLSGVAYVDADNDGVVDGGETLLGGVTIALSGTDDRGAAVSFSTTTDAVTGAYSFANLRPGTYVLTETQPVGLLDGRETAGAQTGTVNNSADSQTISAIPLTAGTNGTGNNFGELLASSLAGTVYRDLDNDGVNDGALAGETGISGATIALTGTDDRGAAVSTSAMTDGVGAYVFAGLRPGTYTIAETQPAGFADGRDTIGTPGGTTANDVFSAIVLPSNTAGANNNFGELPPAGLSGFAYIDADNDGIFDSGETAQVGNIITLTGTDDLGNAVNTSATTDGNGFYAFGTLRPGTYTLTQTQNPALLDGRETAGTPGGTVVNSNGTSQTISGITLVANVAGTDNNFGDLRPATLAGFVYSDADNDGVFEAGETGIVGATVTLTGTDDLGVVVNTSATTVAGGAYSFGALRPGTYTLTETQPAGLLDGLDTIGTPGGTAGNDVFSGIAVTEGTAGANNNFGELQAGSLAGRVYEDDDNDGVNDAGEAGIFNVTIALTGTDDLGNAVSLTETTDLNGDYQFLGLRPGNYVLTQTQPAAYLDGRETAGTPGGTVNNAADSQTIGAIALGVNVAGTGNSFGELVASSLGGTVYTDTNANGVLDGGEPGIDGTTVTLAGTDDRGTAVSATATTAGGGLYVFSGLRPGNYTISETQPAGFLDGVDVAGTAGGTVANDVVSAIALPARTTGAGYNFGETRPSSLAGFVYEDADNNGVFAVGETPIVGAAIALTGTDFQGNAVSRATTTDGTGRYEFALLSPGTYTISETQPAGYLDGRDTLGTPGGTAANDVFSGIVLGENVAGANNNFGEVVAAQVSGSVYLDADNDGVFDGGETGLSGVTVTLTGTDDLGAAVSAVQTTNASGGYSFSGLRPGTYTLTETPPDALFDGRETAGTAGGTVNNLTDSETISGFTLGSAASSTGNNFGELAPASLGGTVYRDLDNDGVNDGGAETGVSGVAIALSGTDDRGNVVAASQLTDGAGGYNFAGLRPGTYALAETQPDGLLDGRDTLGTPGGTAANDAFTAIALPSGVAGTGNNFGELPPASLSGGAYIDANNDGVRDAGETPVATTITLTGTDDLGAAVNRSTPTDALGNYGFTNLRPGTYTLSAAQPAGLLDGRDTQGTPGTGSTGADAFADIVLAAGVDGVANNFGELRPSSVSGTVFRDADNDGVLDGGETREAGVTMTLTGTDDLGAAVTRSTVTDDAGEYLFAGLRPGTYTLSETQPATLLDGIDTLGTQGGTAANDAFTFTLVEGTDGTGNNFAELEAGTISGFVYVDLNGDGLKDVTEPGIAGVRVQLTGTDDLGALVDTTATTDIDGRFTFTEVRPGTYTLTETQPGNYLDGLEAAGSAGGDITTNDVIADVVLAPGGSAVDNLFGERLIPPVPPVEPPAEERRERRAERPVFAYDSFNNFLARRAEAPLPGLSPIDIWRPALLPISPIYSGAANPGATLVIDLYNANGIRVASMTVIADTGGNWLANFGTATLRDTPSDVRITQVNAPYSFGSGVGQNLRTYYAPAALNPGHFLSQNSSGDDDEAAPLLHGLDLANPIQLGPVKYSAEFLPSEGVATGR